MKQLSSTQCSDDAARQIGYANTSVDWTNCRDREAYSGSQRSDISIPPPVSDISAHQPCFVSLPQRDDVKRLKPAIEGTSRSFGIDAERLIKIEARLDESVRLQKDILKYLRDIKTTQFMGQTQIETTQVQVEQEKELDFEGEGIYTVDSEDNVGPCFSPENDKSSSIKDIIREARKARDLRVLKRQKATSKMAKDGDLILTWNGETVEPVNGDSHSRAKLTEMVEYLSETLNHPKSDFRGLSYCVSNVRSGRPKFTAPNGKTFCSKGLFALNAFKSEFEEMNDTDNDS